VRRHIAAGKQCTRLALTWADRVSFVLTESLAVDRFGMVLYGTFAVLALLTAAYLQWTWADPVVGIIGAAVIASWAVGLLRSSGSVLLDVNDNSKMEGLIRQRLETRGDRVTDLHLWQIGPGHRAAVISLVSDDPLPPSEYKRRLSGMHGLSHVTVEVELCRHEQEGRC